MSTKTEKVENEHKVNTASKPEKVENVGELQARVGNYGYPAGAHGAVAPGDEVLLSCNGNPEKGAISVKKLHLTTGNNSNVVFKIISDTDSESDSDSDDDTVTVALDVFYV